MITILKSKKKNSQIARFIKANPDLFSFPKQGDLVDGKILEKGSRAIIIDLGKYGLGVIYRGELLNAGDAIKNADVGETIKAKVLEIDNEDGMIELSLSEAEKQKGWLEVEELLKKEEVIEVKPNEANKGGLVVNISNLKAFLPASQLSSEHYPNIEDNDKNKIEEELKKLIGKPLKVRVIDANSRANKLIISEKAALEASAKELSQNYEVGQVVEVVVSGVADFGVFVKFTDNAVVEGLIHVSELDHKLVENPKDTVKVGGVVKAKITDIKDGKISLSLKALKPDPWKMAGDKFKKGEETEGEVHSFNPFGAIVNLDSEIQGQIHVADFGGEEEMKKKLKVGKKYKFKIKEVKPEDKRINLSFVS